MGRRSDHTRPELREMIVSEGHRQISEVGFARFSAREVAKRIGYTIGTLYNVFGSYDQMLLAINGRTLDLWIAALEGRLEGLETGRLEAAIRAYFTFAVEHRHAWTALYDFRLPEGEPMPDYYREKVEAITGVIVREIAAALPEAHGEKARSLARSLLATVHGHCFFALNGTFALLGEEDPIARALDRVEDALARYEDG
ncbi:TetR family transcriptional regulator [Novosphingobium sp. PC22D]|uniref:TetR/AcrR family transcriptional regulator n=1 Tax=Novosphingobium sp. PC22D TaxID=1962403 RepID=UPI000BF17AE9|nr:TetR/AcrR family transcriptional regulator [Novosphingobium sp. PC22D]PEQ12801.1 TetR family transcriptional regulator [Novosphingobium sp. PC22D]